jgi:hypothetical protein
VRGALNVIPAGLEATYGTRTPAGFAVYLRLRPAPMHMDNGMGGMDHRKMKVMP